MTSVRTADTDRFYELLSRLAERLGGPRRLRECTGADGWPSHGVYFFYEAGETRADGSPRVVRVGTHALTATSKTKLWTRLAQHRGRLGGNNPGGGDHRGSIFRRHVGTGLIASGDWPEGLLKAWLATSPRPGWAVAEAQLERAVSATASVSCPSCGYLCTTEKTGASSSTTASRCSHSSPAASTVQVQLGSAATQRT